MVERYRTRGEAERAFEQYGDLGATGLVDSVSGAEGVRRAAPLGGGASEAGAAQAPYLG